MLMAMQSFFLGEQLAFLRRDRALWQSHLDKIRGFLGMGLARARQGPVLILGAGTGLEIPWEMAPQATWGWDADPWSRFGTLLRHRRLAPWKTGDITGVLSDFECLTQRALKESWSGRRRSPDIATCRLKALLESYEPRPADLEHWIESHQPKTILAANFMGQITHLLQSRVEKHWLPHNPWQTDPEQSDPLLEAVDAFGARTIRALLDVLKQSGAELWLVHDRATMDGFKAGASLGPFDPDWRSQLGAAMPAAGHLEAYDPLAGVDIWGVFAGRTCLKAERWLWPVGEGQVHLMEALAFEASVTKNASSLPPFL